MKKAEEGESEGKCYKCEHCSYFTYVEGCLKVHMKKVHDQNANAAEGDNLHVFLIFFAIWVQTFAGDGLVDDI